MSSLLASTDFAGRSNSCRDSRPTPHLSSSFRDFLPITCLFWKFGKASLDSEQTPSQSHNTSLMINRSMSGSVLQCSHPHWSAPLATRTTRRLCWNRGHSETTMLLISGTWSKMADSCDGAWIYRRITAILDRFRVSHLWRNDEYWFFLRLTK